MRSIPVDVEVGSLNIENLELRMTAPLDIAGQVEYDDEAAKPKADAAKTRPRVIQLRPVGGQGWSPKGATVGADGGFTVEKVHPDLYEVYINWAPSYVKSARFGGVEMEGPVLDLRSAAPGSALTLRVSSALATLKGTVQDEKGPATRAMVILCMETESTNNMWRSTDTDASGAYSIELIRPGRYKLLAVDGKTPSPVSQGRLAEDWAEAAEMIDLKAKDALTRDLKILVKPSK